MLFLDVLSPLFVYKISNMQVIVHFRTDRKYGVNNGGSIGSSSSGLGSSGGLLSGDSEGASDSARIKRENILSELLVTESKYASDLQQVLRNYR